MDPVSNFRLVKIGVRLSKGHINLTKFGLDCSRFRYFLRIEDYWRSEKNYMRLKNNTFIPWPKIRRD